MHFACFICTFQEGSDSKNYKEKIRAIEGEESCLTGYSVKNNEAIVGRYDILPMTSDAEQAIVLRTSLQPQIRTLRENSSTLEGVFPKSPKDDESEIEF